MKTRHGDKQRAYARMLLEKGVPYSDILKDSALQGFNPATLRSLKRRMEKRNDVATIATKMQRVAPAKVEMQRNATQCNAPENDGKKPKKANFYTIFHPADLLYYSCVAISGAGIVGALHQVGYAVAGVLFCVAGIALHGIKTAPGISRIPHLLILAVVEIAGFVAHLSWANAALWRDVSHLPFDIWPDAYRNNVGETVLLYGGPDVDKPFAAACGVAVVLFFVAVYVCALAIQGQKNRIEKAQK